MKLSNRLRCVADMVTEHQILLDVGCDHGYIPITLLEEGKIGYAVASDIRIGPLSRAKEHVEAAGLADRVSLVCVGGIPKDFRERLPKKLHQARVSCVIAGMGGMLMAGILEEAGEVLSDIDELILSPQSDLSYFRRMIGRLQLHIAEEKFLKEDGKYYTVLRCTHGTKDEMQEMSLAQLAFGPCLLKEKNPTLLEYLKKRVRVLEGIRLQLLANDYTQSNQRMEELTAEMAKVKEAISMYETEETAQKG